MTGPAWWVQQDLEDRYNRLRLEVQLAADRGEAASEAELVRRTMAKEKTAHTGKGFFGAARYASGTAVKGCLVLVECMIWPVFEHITHPPFCKGGLSVRGGSRYVDIDRQLSSNTFVIYIL